MQMVTTKTLNNIVLNSHAYKKFIAPTRIRLPHVTPLTSRGDKPLSFTFQHQLEALIFLHLQGFESGAALLQAMEEDGFARKHIAPPDGVKKSTFYDAINDRGLLQLQELFAQLCQDAGAVVSREFAEFGDLVAVDGSLVEATLSMHWAEYRKKNNKFRVHVGFNVNQGIPQKLFLTPGKDGERPFVSKIVNPGQTGILDRGYQDHGEFDQWQEDGRHFVCRIKKRTLKELITLEQFDMDPETFIFFDAKVRLGHGQSKTKKPLRVVGYRIARTEYYVATDRFDLKAEEVATIYKLRWEVEKFFAWWKKQLNVYHLIARSPYGVLVQIFAGLITYLLMAIYCAEQHGERVSMKRVRQLKTQIQNELRGTHTKQTEAICHQKRPPDELNART
jgi:hypothetical protein